MWLMINCSISKNQQLKFAGEYVAPLLKKMIDSGATTCLTISGAMTPIGLGKSISALIENGLSIGL